MTADTGYDYHMKIFNTCEEMMLAVENVRTLKFVLREIAVPNLILISIYRAKTLNQRI